MIGPDLVVLGCLTLDSVMTSAGDCLPQTFGGNVIYSALGARIWNDRVGAVSRYGTGYPEAAFDLLRSRGINTDGIRHVGSPHGRQIAFCYTEDGSRTRMFPPEVIARIPRRGQAAVRRRVASSRCRRTLARLCAERRRHPARMVEQPDRRALRRHAGRDPKACRPERSGAPGVRSASAGRLAVARPADARF